MKNTKLFLTIFLIFLIAGGVYYKLNSESKEKNLIPEKPVNMDAFMIDREISSFLYTKLNNKTAMFKNDESNEDDTSQKIFSEETMKRITSTKNQEEKNRIMAEDEIKTLSFNVDYYKKILKKKNEKNFINYFNNKGIEFLKSNKRNDLISKLPQLFKEFIINLEEQKIGTEKKIEKIKKNFK